MKFLHFQITYFQNSKNWMTRIFLWNLDHTLVEQTYPCYPCDLQRRKWEPWLSMFRDFQTSISIWLAIYFAVSFFIFSSLSVSASDLISRLVRGEVCRSEQIQSHPFFKGVNWNEVSCTQFSYTVLGPFGQRVHAKNDHPPAKKHEDSGHEIAWVLPIYTYTLNRWHNPTTRYCKVCHHEQFMCICFLSM